MFPTTIMFGRELLGMPVWLTDFLSCLISLQLEVSFSISIRAQEKKGEAQMRVHIILLLL